MDVDAVFQRANELLEVILPTSTLVFAVWVGVLTLLEVARTVFKTLMDKEKEKPKNDDKRKNDQIIHDGDVLAVVDPPENGRL